MLRPASDQGKDLTPGLSQGRASQVNVTGWDRASLKHPGALSSLVPPCPLCGKPETPEPHDPRPRPAGACSVHTGLLASPSSLCSPVCSFHFPTPSLSQDRDWWGLQEPRRESDKPFSSRTSTSRAGGSAVTPSSDKEAAERREFLLSRSKARNHPHPQHTGCQGLLPSAQL